MTTERFNFDETGDTFYCFLLAIYTVILLPVTYYFWPRPEPKPSIEALKRRCQCAPCQAKRASLRSSSTSKCIKRGLIKLAIFIAWIGFLMLVFKISQIEVTMSGFDPYEELQISPDASKTEIKKAYKRLSLIHHPDRGGDEQKFIRIHKAYITLTDEVAHKNWQEYGNSDGPGAINFGMALPKWMIRKENRLLVVGVYALVFMLILPLVVGLWWSKSMRYSHTSVLLVTVRLYCGSFLYIPFMAVNRLIKLLSSSYEFNRQFNRNIACRPSDNVELPPFISQIPMFTMFKKAIVGAPYSIKARVLIYAHMLRLDLPPKTLLVDKQYIIAQCPRLIEEMINSLLIVLAISTEDRGGKKKMPQILASMENCMLLSSLVIQALSPTNAVTPLLQLPHIGPTQLRLITHNQRNLRGLRQLASLPEGRRKALLSFLTDEQYRDVINVLVSMPLVRFTAVRTDVLGEETEASSGEIWPLSMVTVTVRLLRRPLLVNSTTMESVGGGCAVVDASTDLRCTDRDASWYMAAGFEDLSAARGTVEEEGFVGEQLGEEGFETNQSQAPKSSNKPVWDKSRSRGNRGGNRGGGKGKGKHNQKPTKTKNNATKPPTQEPPEDEQDLRFPNGDGKVDAVEFPHSMEGGDASSAAAEASKISAELDAATVTRRKEMNRALENKPRCSHIVHCPFFPSEKFEGWWLYMVDRKTKQLVTKPVYIDFLENEEEFILKFVAPTTPGVYQYTLCLRSDSYVDLDFIENVSFTVKALPEHVLRSLREAESRSLECGSYSSSSESEDLDDEDFEGDENFDLDEDIDAKIPAQ